MAPVPPGTITSASLDLYMNKAAPNGGGTFILHVLTTDWGEGSSIGVDA